MQVLQGEGGRIAKVWTDDLANVESGALDQIRLMLQLPGLFRHIAIMPDVHLGQGAVIGGVVATERVLVPNVVGVDIGCGLDAFNTGVHYDRSMMDKAFWRQWKSRVDRAIPAGFARHDKPQDMGVLSIDAAPLQAKELWNFQRDVAPAQLGTLGGGNHFCEAAYDEDGAVWLTVHSGSRNTGLQIANHYNRLARHRNEQWHATTPKDLWFLPLDSQEGHDYFHDMKWATRFALENRYAMLEAMAEAFMDMVSKASGCTVARYRTALRDQSINIHHNYAAVEHHDGVDVVVHRKGATRARVGELGIIPGSMGSSTYIVKGLGNPESYESCSHGAGRRMSRKQAKQTITEAAFAASLSDTFTSPSTKLLDEAPDAYKDVESVMANQTDLVEVIHTLRPIITIKGQGD